MMRAFLVPILAAGLAFGGTVKEAKALNAEETAALIAGLAIVGIIASNSNNNRAQAATRSAPLTTTNRGGHKNQRRAVLPAQCLVRIDTNRGNRTVAGERCLERNGVRTARLPNNCEVQVRTNRGLRDGFRQRCLENAGYRFKNAQVRDGGRRTLDAGRNRF